MLTSIGVLDRSDRLKAHVDQFVEGIRRTRPVDLVTRREGAEEILEIACDLDPEMEQEMRRELATAIGVHIISDLEPVLLDHICVKTYGHLSEEEKASVLSLADKALREPEAQDKDRKGEIVRRLLDYLQGENRLNLKGFITFRLKDYMDDMEDAVDQAIDDFFLEKEYTEFVRLLRYFVEAQEPRMSEVHVTVSREGSFALFDQEMHPVDGGNLREFIVDTLESEVAYEDFLVSALISLAPRRVVIHDALGLGDEESVTTVKNVFSDRVSVCKGCRRCQKWGRV